jgi:hypothetical protein
MKYLILGAITEAGQQLTGPGLESWMAEIGGWYEKQGGAGTLADPGHQLETPDKARTIRASGVTDGPFMEAKEVLGGYSLLEAATIDEAAESLDGSSAACDPKPRRSPNPASVEAQTPDVGPERGSAVMGGGRR